MAVQAHIGMEVEVIQHDHGLKGRRGHVVDIMRSGHLVIDFGVEIRWKEVNAFGQPIRKTHNCFGRLARDTGYVFRERELLAVS